MPYYPSITTAGEFESTAVQNAIKALAQQVLTAGMYDSGRRNITALATGLTGGKVMFRVKNGWARIVFEDVTVAAAGNAYPFGNDGPLAAWGPAGSDTGRGFVTAGDTNQTSRVYVSNRGAIGIYGIPANTKLNGYVMWPFDRTPPATPFGDAA